MKMKYTIQTSVEAARGVQVWEVIAESEAEALQKFKDGESEFVTQEVEVMSIGKPEIMEQEPVEEKK